MESIEKRDYIHSHLHQIDNKFIDEMYNKMSIKLQDNNTTVGYDASGNPISRVQFVADIKEAEEQIERGEYITIEDLESESKTW